MKQIVLTGAGGFLGKAILAECTLYQEVIVYALTRQANKLREEFREHTNIKIVLFECLEEIPWNQIDVIIHGAFPMGQDGRERAEGLDFTKQIMQIGNQYGCDVIHISTQSVYSQKRKESATEETLVELESEYAIGKYAAELITSSLCMHNHYTNVRLGSLIGVGLEARLVNKFIKAVCEGEVISLKGGKQFFDFMDVRDAARAIVKLACSNPKEWEEVYNLGSAAAYSLEEIVVKVIELAKEMLGIVGQYVLEEAPLWHNSSLNSDKFQSQFEMIPQYTLEDTIKLIIESNYKHLIK